MYEINFKINMCTYSHKLIHTHRQLTLMSLLTFAGCNSSLFLVALRNPPGRGAAFYYHPLSEKGHDTNHYRKLDPLFKKG